MRRALSAPLLAVAFALSSCGDGGSTTVARNEPAEQTAARFSTEVRTNFLDSCIENARNTANGAASEQELAATCECILSRVEQEYSESEFAEFEQRLLDGTASEQESVQLTDWSTACAEESTG